MLLVFLILFTKILADSDEDKYVDLLPDAEKQQFIEKVARRILKDVQSHETGKGVESGEISEEQLTKHNEFVKAILKQEADYIRRSKGELNKDDDDKSESEEKDNLGVKPLQSEKLAVADDTDLERVDLTLRNDRREIGGNDDNTTDFIKVEIVTDAAPKIKRSAPNITDSETSESDDFTSETYEKTESTTEKFNEVKITSEKYENLMSTIENKDVFITTTKKPELTTVDSNNNKTNNESLVNTESVINKQDHRDTKNNISKNEQSKNTTIIESTTPGNEGIGQTEPKNYYSSESDEEELEVKSINEHTRRYNNSNDTSKATTKINTVIAGMEYFGFKSMENKSDEYNSGTITDIEEITTLANKDNTATDNILTTHNADAFTDISSRTYTQGTEKDIDTTTEYVLNTLTSTLTDEGTDFITETSTYSPSTEILTTKASTGYTTESTYKNVETITEELKIFVEDFTSKPTRSTTLGKKDLNNNNLELPIQTKKIKASQQHPITKDITTRNINLDEDSIEPTTKRNKPKTKVHKVETVIKLPKKIYNNAITAEQSFKETNIKTKHVKNNLSVDNNFIELEKVYYDNNYKVKTGNKYNVYEIPADKSPFIVDEQPMTEQPYYVPIYNYAPNNAYFNPVNRLGPNPDDDSLDDVGAFSLIEDLNSAQESHNNVKTKNYDIEYSDTAFDIKRKKFGSKQKLTHTIHKVQQQTDSHEKKRGKVNPEDYLDSDYYFGRVRKDLERRDNHNSFDLFPNSNEYDHPTHSIQEMSLKDHVRAVRNILFQQKKFGPPDRQGKELERSRKGKKGIKRKPNKLLVNDINYVTRNGNNDSKNKGNNVGDNNIAIDYYFGRMKPTAVITSDMKYADNDKHFQKVGYIKNLNNTKELYVMDEFFKENVVKYLTEIQSKDSTYVKADLMSATPHPVAKMNLVSAPKQTRNGNITRFRNEEMKRNAAIMKNFAKNQTANKVDRFFNIKDGLENNHFFFPIKMRSDHKNNILKDKISSVRKEVMNDKLNSTTNHDMNLRLNRRNDVVKVGVYIQVLKDMISLDNKALKQYDWLGTAVDIQSALQKLFELIDLVVNDDPIHPADLEILRYVLFLHKLANEIIQANDFGAQLRKKLILPRNKKKEKHRLLKEKGLINRVWLYLRREVPDINEDMAIKNLNQFLMDTEDCLYNLHDAIKNIAKITKYKNQHWYQNLKELYLNTDDKRVLEVLLHMTVSRIFELIESSANNGLEDDYVDYMKGNKKTAKKTLEEILFAIQILDEINKIVD